MEEEYSQFLEHVSQLKKLKEVYRTTKKRISSWITMT